jgi:hypothetical protein
MRPHGITGLERVKNTILLQHVKFQYYKPRISDPRDKKDRQCTYKVTLRRVLATTVAVEKQ